MKEVAKVLGISLGDCQVGTRRQEAKQEKRGTKVIKQEEKQKQEIEEWGKIKVEMVDSRKIEKFGCTECYKQFKRNDHLKRHQLKHTTEGEPKIRFPCTYCDKTFSLTFKLAIHIKDNHQVPNEVSSNFGDDALDSEKSFACVRCPKTFENDQQRYKHNSRQHSGVTNKCDECVKQFSRTDKLYTHKKNMH